MAETYSELRDAIGDFVLPIWNTVTERAPLLFENMDNPRAEGNTWGRLTVRQTSATRASLGNACRFRRFGTVYVQIFVPKNTGLETADAIGEALVEAFENAGQIGNVWFRDVSLREVGPDADSSFYQTNVEASYTFDRLT
jgi:hypothetical protein